MTENGAPTDINVTAVPQNPEDPENTPYLVECNICGPLGTFPGRDVDIDCIEHVGTHGVDVEEHVRHLRDIRGEEI